MRLKDKIRYPSIMCFLLGFASLLFMFTEQGRVFPNLLPYYIVLKFSTAVACFSLGYYLIHHSATDRTLALLMFVMISYSITSLWFLPLYEVSYFQIAIGCAFLLPRRRWIFPVIFGIGGMAIVGTYYLQDQLHWQKPQAVRADWIWGVFFLFIVAWFIHQFALRNSRRETEKRLRYSLIGRESTRLIHDLKGLLGSPLLLLESLKSAREREDIKYLLATTDLLQHDLIQVREVLSQLNRLVIVNNDLVPTEITSLLKEATNVLRYRLHGVEILYPEPRHLSVAPERLHSVFFNLFLNSVEAFQQNTVAKPQIRIFWCENVLNFCDNAGGMKVRPGQASTKRSGSGGLGLEIIHSELDAMNITFRLRNQPEGISATLSFRV